jgi:hypothetical protein
LVICVIVAEAPDDKPVTVSKRLDPDVDVTLTTPEVTVAVSQVNAELKLVIVTVNPSAVEVGVENVGFRGESNAVAFDVTDPVPLLYAVRLVVWVSVED